MLMRKRVDYRKLISPYRSDGSEYAMTVFSNKADQAFFSKRVIQTKITAPTNATMVEPIIPAPGQIPNIPKIPPKKAAEDAENDVYDYAVAATLHDLASKQPAISPTTIHARNPMTNPPWVRLKRPN